MPSAQSPSPPPEAPTALTPGARASAIQTLYASALDNTLRSISYSSFAACFPSIAAAAPESLRSVHKDFLQRLGDFASHEFHTILEERNVVIQLNKLEDLIAAAKIRKSRTPDDAPAPIPPHTLPPQAVLAAHLDPVRRGQQSQLNARLQTVECDNAALAKKMMEQRKEIEMLLGALEGRVEDLRRGGEEIENVGVEVSGESRKAEEVLQKF
ncbi:Nnf1-domain-containing protein [Calycina marina]|uniref:Nnf1-domain-containing protein n=1 Tax=Calycina marina TaxID=1763456 RepID=A0A9P7YY82_9HELO|nr:Nnf1-domain-containing protein [Calycina marina]